jgi:pimeloyl-ACP methyl ester carboxylesterase
MPDVHPLANNMNAETAKQQAMVDKIQVPFDPRVQYMSAFLNGYTYGYLFSPASPTVPKRGTIFLIHGFPDISMGWRYQIPFLTKLGLDVIAPDCMGYGRTDAPEYTLQDYSFRRVAADIAELCRQRGLTRILLGGHDWGGSIVYRIAQYHPNLIYAVFSICTPYSPPLQVYDGLDMLVHSRLPNFGYQRHFVSGELEEKVKSKAEIRQFLNNLYGARTTDTKEVAFSANTGLDLEKQKRVGLNKLMSAAEMDYYVDEYARHGVHGPLNWYRTREINYINELSDFFGHDIDSSPTSVSPSRFPANKQKLDLTMKMEVLFVHATNDMALLPHMSKKMEERIPRLTRETVVAGHWILWERPQDANNVIRKWLEDKVFPGFGREMKL